MADWLMEPWYCRLTNWGKDVKAAKAALISDCSIEVKWLTEWWNPGIDIMTNWRKDAKDAKAAIVSDYSTEVKWLTDWWNPGIDRLTN